MIIKIGIICLTGYKTIDLMMSTLPPDQKWLGIAGVFTVDVALLYWDHYMGDPKLAKCRPQRWIGGLGIIANLLAITVIMVADSARYVSKEKFDDVIVIGSVIGLAVIAVINLSLAVAGHQLDPDRQLAEEKARHEREMELKKKQYAQQMEAAHTIHQLESAKQQQANDLEIEALAHRQRLNAAKDQYMRTHTTEQPKSTPQPQADDPGIKDILRKALGLSDEPKPQEARSMAAEGEAAPKVTSRE